MANWREYIQKLKSFKNGVYGPFFESVAESLEKAHVDAHQLRLAEQSADREIDQLTTDLATVTKERDELAAQVKTLREALKIGDKVTVCPEYPYYEDYKDQVHIIWGMELPRGCTDGPINYTIIEEDGSWCSDGWKAKDLIKQALATIEGGKGGGNVSEKKLVVCQEAKRCPVFECPCRTPHEYDDEQCQMVRCPAGNLEASACVEE